MLLPSGYHGPSMAAPGYDLYYLNVMAGPGERAWRFTDDPAHAWIRDTWEGQEIDPRLQEGCIMRLTVAQALVRFLANQHTERDGVEQRLIAGCFGIFGHGNVAGVGQALLEQREEMPYVLARNEQAMVHAAAGYARQKNRLSTYACTASVGPGSTNMVTGAALATINRLPVLLLPGDIFATRVASPVLQELEDPTSLDVSVNDCFKPVSRFWDRINRPEQLIASALAAMRVLTDPAETGAVTLSLPQDVQAEAFDWPEEFFARRVWHVRRPPAEPERLAEAAELLRGARRPLIVCGGGTIYAEATDALRALAEATGVPVAETQAGKGSLPYDHPQSLGAIGATGTTAANAIAREADVVLGVGTRWSDFTTASRSLFADPGVRFVNLNVASVDAFKHAGLPLVADARAGLEALRDALEGWRADAAHTERARAPRRRVGRDGRARVHARPHAAAGPERGDRRRQPRQRPARRRRLRRGQHAGRPAQALAHARPEGLPRRVRLLVHGLRDRRRARRQAGRARPRGLRDGRRRLVPDDGPGDRHRRAGGDQAHDRARPEPRLRLDRRALGVGRVAALRHRATAAATARCCPSTSRRSRPASAPRCTARARSTSSSRRCARRPPRRASRSWRSRPTRSSARPTPRRGGTSRSPRWPGWTPRARRARPTSENKRTQRQYVT